MEREGTVARKAKRSGLFKTFRKYGFYAMDTAIPFARYTIIPGLILYSLYYTEPNPTLSDLLNPFF